MKLKRVLSVSYLMLLSVNISFAQQISEIMFDPDGSDTDREWIEIYNNTNLNLNITEHKFFEANVNHGIDGIGAENFLSSGEYAVIVQDVNKFKADFPSYSKKIFTASFSLNNSGELLSLKDKDGKVTHEVNYAGLTAGAGTGKTLGFSATNWLGQSPDPGSGGLVVNITLQEVGASTTTSSNLNNTNTGTIFTPTYIQPSAPWPVQDKIFVNAGENRITLVGVENIFLGKAIGSDKKTLNNAVFHWSLGDGNTIQGETVRHIYKYPGEYTVVLEVFSDGALEQHKIYVKVEKPDLELNLLKKEDRSMIEILNKNTNELNLTGLQIRSIGIKEDVFQLPKNFSILPKKCVVIDEKFLSLDLNTRRIQLEYLDGQKIFEIVNNSTSTLSTELSTSTTSIAVYTLEEWEKMRGEFVPRNSNPIKLPNKNTQKVKSRVTPIKNTLLEGNINENLGDQNTNRIEFSDAPDKPFWKSWLNLVFP